MIDSTFGGTGGKRMMRNEANEMTDKLTAINQVDHEMGLKKFQVKGYDCLWLIIMSTPKIYAIHSNYSSTEQKRVVVKGNRGWGREGQKKHLKCLAEAASKCK